MPVALGFGRVAPVGSGGGRRRRLACSHPSSRWLGRGIARLGCRAAGLGRGTGLRGASETERLCRRRPARRRLWVGFAAGGVAAFSAGVPAGGVADFSAGVPAPDLFVAAAAAGVAPLLSGDGVVAAGAAGAAAGGVWPGLGSGAASAGGGLKNRAWP